MVKRYAARTDGNQQEIIDALRACGVSVHVIGEPVDLLVGHRGRTGTLEVKDGSKPASARQLTKQQVDFQAEQRGFFRVVTSVDEAIAAIKEMVL